MSAADQAGKQDAGKPRFSLFPLEALHEVLKVLEHGAKKYTADGWRETVGAEHGQRRYLDAAYRHAFMEWWANGERVDKESGVHHLAHAICCLLFNLQLDLERPTATWEGLGRKLETLGRRGVPDDDGR